MVEGRWHVTTTCEVYKYINKYACDIEDEMSVGCTKAKKYIEKKREREREREREKGEENKFVFGRKREKEREREREVPVING